MIALLGDELVRGREFEGPHVNRLLRISLHGGEVQRERTLGRRLTNRPVDNRDAFRLNLAAGPLLALTPDGSTLAVLVREPAPGRDTVAVVDAESFETRCSHPLPKGVRHSGLLLGRSGTLYAFGNRRARGSNRWDALLSVVDAQTGAVAATRTLREAKHGEWTGSSTDWFIYGGALSPDERRIVLSYHGHDTTGADRFRVSPGSHIAGRVYVPLVHGAVEAPERGSSARRPRRACSGSIGVGAWSGGFR